MTISSWPRASGPFDIGGSPRLFRYPNTEGQLMPKRHHVGRVGGLGVVLAAGFRAALALAPEGLCQRVAREFSRVRERPRAAPDAFPRSDRDGGPRNVRGWADGGAGVPDVLLPVPQPPSDVRAPLRQLPECRGAHADPCQPVGEGIRQARCLDAPGAGCPLAEPGHRAVAQAIRVLPADLRAPGGPGRRFPVLPARWPCPPRQGPRIGAIGRGSRAMM